MDYQEIQATGFLSNFIKCFWKYEHTQDDTEHTILPDACFDLIVDFKNGILQDISLTGVWAKPINVTVTKGTTFFAIRFKIIAAEYIFKREIKSILNTMVSLPSDFWNLNTISCNEFEKFINTLSRQMALSLKHLKVIDDRKLKLFNLIYNKGYYNVKNISENVHWSSRQINRYFDQQYGFPLKTLLNIVRCNTSYKNIAQGKLYATKEYTDQAHFIKEIKKYTENTPSQLSKNKNDRFLQLSTISEK